MTKVVIAMSLSLDGIAGPEAADADGMEHLRYQVQ
jgi:hypothetical protein